MKAPYRAYPGPDGTTLYYPLLRVRIGIKRAPPSRCFEALVDSGASDCMFQASIATAIGINLKAGELQTRTGIGGVPQEVRVHPIVLYVGENALNIKAAFSETLPCAGLLGRVGFFEHFRITFDPTTEPPGLELERIHKA